MIAGSIDLNSKDSLPDLASPAAVPGLSGTVDLRRDAWGIPHIRAASHLDAFAGLGFAHAQDRLWQMEALLRRGTGRYAEWVGKSAVAGDVLARQLDTAGASRRDFALLNAETRAMLEAYARGVNAFIALGRWPVEYTILDAKPAAWEPWHSIAVMRQIGFLMGSVWWKLWRAAALPIVGAAEIPKLRFDDGGDDMLCIPPGAEGATLSRGAGRSEAGPGSAARRGHEQQDAEVAGGSNNWALGPRTHRTGQAARLRATRIGCWKCRAMYAQAHLACDELRRHRAHRSRRAGLSEFRSQRQGGVVRHARLRRYSRSLYRTFRCHRREHALQGRLEAGPAPCRDHRRARRRERRGRRGRNPSWSGHRRRPCRRHRTGAALGAVRGARHIVRLHDSGVAVLDRGGIVRGWPRMGPDGSQSGRRRHQPVHRQPRARKVPARPRANGWLPVPGWTGEHEWNGMVPFEDMPCTIDPAEQAIVTANNRVMENGEHYLSTDSMPPHRARRIWQRLAALSKANVKATVEDMASIHRDTVSVVALEFRDRIRTVAVEGAAATLRDRILDWNGDMAADSSAAVAYAALRTALTRLVADKSGVRSVADSPYAKVPPGIFGENQIWWTVPQLLRANDTGLLAGATWDELALAGAGGRCGRLSFGGLGRRASDQPAASVVGRLSGPCASAGQGLRTRRWRQ